MESEVFDKGPKHWIYRRQNSVQNEEGFSNGLTYPQAGESALWGPMCSVIRRV